MDAVRILAVDDNPADIYLLKEYLGETPGTPFEVVGAQTLAEALALLPTGGFAAILLDLNLPDCTGLDGLARLAANGVTLPIVVLTGLGDATAGLQALAKGAQDYLVKGKIDAESLSRSVRYAIERHRAAETARHLGAELERRAAEVSESNAALRESRRAALNLMDDALAARQRSEQVLEALREAHVRAKWLARFPEENPEPVLRVSADGSVLYANPAATGTAAWTDGESGTVAPPLRLLVGRAMTEGRTIEQDVELEGRTYAVAVAPFLQECYANLYGRDITQRKAAEQDVARAKEEWERTFDSVPDLITILDTDHRIVRVNGALAKRLGRTPEQCVGLACYESVHGCTKPLDICPHQLTLGDGHEHVAEVHEERLHGDFEVTTTPLRDARGQMTGAVHVARDITERKRREVQLQKLNRALNALGHSGQALGRATGEADFLAEACRIVVEDCGYAMVWIGFAEDDEAKTIRPAAWAGFEDGYLDTLQLTWADHERGHGPTGTAIRTGQVCRCRDMLTDPAFGPWREDAGKRGYASSIALPLLAEGRALGALTLYSREAVGFSDDEVALLTDLAADFVQGVTTLRTRAAKEQAEKAVRESEERYHVLFGTMAEGFALHEIVTDAQGRPCDYRYLDVNPAFERLTGLRRDQVLGKSVLEVLPKTEPLWIESFGRVALTGEPLHLEEYSAALGRWFDVSAYCVAPGRFAAVFADISDRKAAEEKVWNLNRGLEERVRERTAELRASEGRLRRLAAQFATAQDEEQQRIAEALHDDVAQVLAACNVKLAVALLSPDAAIVEKCQRELERLLREANEKVRLMSFELGTATLYRLGLEEAVRELAESMEERHGIHIAVNSDGAGKRLDSAAAVVLYKAVRELLFNVIKHAGTPEATVSLQAGEGQLTVSVEDCGKGFSQPPSAVGVSVGSGLGLFGIRERVADLGGTVHIESEPDVRTCIALTVPLGAAR